MTKDQVSEAIMQIENLLRLFLWKQHQFPRLTPALVHRLEAAGITRLDQLYAQINRLIRRGGIGPFRFKVLEKWLHENGKPSLVPMLDEKSKRKLGIT